MMGRSQVVRQRILIPPYGGSNPPAPANIFNVLAASWRRFHVAIACNKMQGFPPFCSGLRPLCATCLRHGILARMTRTWSLNGGRPCARPELEPLLESQKATFRALALEMKYGAEPTRLAFGGLISLGEVSVRTSRQFWGDMADAEPRHGKWKADVQRDLERVEARVSEGELIRSHAVAVARAGSTPAGEAPGPKPGWVSGKALCVRIAEEILASSEAPARGRGLKRKLADAVLARLHAQGMSYRRASVERYLRELKVI